MYTTHLDTDEWFLTCKIQQAYDRREWEDMEARTESSASARRHQWLPTQPWQEVQPHSRRAAGGENNKQMIVIWKWELLTILYGFTGLWSPRKASWQRLVGCRGRLPPNHRDEVETFWWDNNVLTFKIRLLLGSWNIERLFACFTWSWADHYYLKKYGWSVP